MSQPMRFLSLFSGIGAFDHGLEQAGWECAAQCEIEPFQRLVLQKYWPNLPRWSDVRKLTGDAVRQHCGVIDAICGGPPCQPASIAGKKQGSQDARWLWPDTVRLVGEIRPTWCIFENPFGFLDLPEAQDVLGELENAGYEIWPMGVAALDVGASHERRRVWIVANANSQQFQRRGELGNVAGTAREDEGDGGQRQRLRDATDDSGEVVKWRFPAWDGEQQHDWEEPRLIRPDAERQVVPANDGSAGGLVRPTRRRAKSLAKWLNEQIIRGAGNAVVWQIPYLIASAINEMECEHDRARMAAQ